MPRELLARPTRFSAFAPRRECLYSWWIARVSRRYAMLRRRYLSAREREGSPLSYIPRDIALRRRECCRSGRMFRYARRCSFWACAPGSAIALSRCDNGALKLLLLLRGTALAFGQSARDNRFRPARAAFQILNSREWMRARRPGSGTARTANRDHRIIPCT